MKLIYGTENAGKLAFMRKYLENLPIEIIGIGELSFEKPEIDEKGKFPLENAREKALAYYRVLKQPVFSVDSGLFIEGLSEEEQPGVHVRRLGNKRMNDQKMRAYYKSIAERFGGRCTAGYRNGICLVFSEDEIYEHEGDDISWDKFYLSTDERPQEQEGFPLDAISLDYKTGAHFYDLYKSEKEKAVTEDKNGFEEFFRKALLEHERRLGR